MACVFQDLRGMNHIQTGLSPAFRGVDLKIFLDLAKYDHSGTGLSSPVTSAPSSATSHMSWSALGHPLRVR